MNCLGKTRHEKDCEKIRAIEWPHKTKSQKVKTGFLWTQATVYVQIGDNWFETARFDRWRMTVKTFLDSSKSTVKELSSKERQALEYPIRLMQVADHK